MSKSKSRPLRVGDICVTVNSKYPAINNGLTVVIIGIDPAFKDHKGVRHPYTIRRVDGQPLGLVTRNKNELVWCKLLHAHCVAERLQHVPDSQDGFDRQVAITQPVEQEMQS